MMKLTPCKLKEIVREEVQRLSEDEIGWDNLPDGWDEESVESFAQNLTGQEGEEGFFSACMDEVEDKFDDPEAFCASLKDEYLDTTDWRGESVNKSNSMKLTESKLRSIIREELTESRGEYMDMLRSVRKELSDLEMQVSNRSFEGEFTRGETEDLQRKFKEIRSNLEEVEQLIVKATI